MSDELVKFPHFVSKGWGFEKWIVNKEYCGKLLYFVKDKKCSLHMHIKKDEVFYVHSGKIKVLFTDNPKQIDNTLLTKSPKEIKKYLQEIILERGDNFHVPRERLHQIIALEDTELFEFSTHHEDSDSLRVIKGD